MKECRTRDVLQLVVVLYRNNRWRTIIHEFRSHGFHNFHSSESCPLMILKIVISSVIENINLQHLRKFIIGKTNLKDLKNVKYLLNWELVHFLYFILKYLGHDLDKHKAYLCRSRYLLEKKTAIFLNSFTEHALMKGPLRLSAS